MGNVRRRLIAAQPHLVTASGETLGVAVAEPKINRLAVTFAPVQTGIGTPSPSNVRPIYGWSEIPVGMTPGYGDVLAAVPEGKYGTIDLATGIMTVTWVTVDLGSLTWELRNNSSSRQAWKTASVLPIKPVSYGSEPLNGISTQFATKSLTDSWGQYIISYHGNSSESERKTIVVTFPSSAYSTADQAKAALSGIPLAYELATPETVQLSGITPRPGTVTVMPFQQGGGTPSPTNVRPIIPVVNGPSISLGGTYYGGTVDLVSGAMTVTHAMETVSNRPWTYDSSFTRFVASLPNYISNSGARTTELLSDKFQAIYDGRSIGSVPDYSIYSGSAHEYVYVKVPSSISTTAAFKEAFGDSQIVYPLETPQTVQLSPQTIAALRGQQTVTSPAGAVEISYWTH